jgi:hypothetical protein
MGDGDARIGCSVGALFSYVDMEARVPATHPLRTIRTIVNEVLAALYESIGRQSVTRSDCCAPHCCRHFTLCVPSVS